MDFRLVDLAPQHRSVPTTSSQTSTSLVVEVLNEPHLHLKLIIRVPKLVSHLGITEARSSDRCSADLGPCSKATLTREPILKRIRRCSCAGVRVSPLKNKQSNHVGSKGDRQFIVSASLHDELQVHTEA
jgi:hypothetical protein